MSERIYPCDDCGVLRTAEEGGTTFTVCDDCWCKHYGHSTECAHADAAGPQPPGVAEDSP